MKNNAFILFFILLTAVSVLPVKAVAADAERLLQEAEKAFKEGNELLNTEPEAANMAYLRSAQYYGSIIDSGIKNAGLYYNSANAYVRLGLTGRAVLNYRRALLHSPNDPQIRYNLDYARSLQKNGFEKQSENEIMHILFFWHYTVPLLWKSLILAGANLVFWTVLILGRFGRPFRRTAVISLAAAVVFAGSLGADIHASSVQHGVVTAESATGRLGDSRSYESAYDAPLYQGVEFTVRQRRPGWLLAELPDGGLVWLEETDCGIIEE